MEKKQGYRVRAQTLRREATKEENRLWYEFLRTFPVQFRRQKVLKPYSVDFYCAAARLVVELDGGQHFGPQEQERDRRRTAFLAETWQLKVLRFSNAEIRENFRGVCGAIVQEVRQRLPSEKQALIEELCE